MRSVLIISYFFPPMGGAGVQRTLKFVKYLPEFGWQPHVLTVQTTTNLKDLSLVKELPTGLPIMRTPILRPPKQFPWRLRSFISRWFLIVDEQLGWLPFANTAGRRVISGDNQIKAIYSTSAPYTAHLVARHLHIQTHLPWVADFRDPWMGNPYIKFPTAFHRQINEHLEKRVFTEADRVILNTESSQKYYKQKYTSLPTENFSTISNGYDQSDLPGTSQNLNANSDFTIVHLGSLYQKTRSSEYFLTALHDAFESGKLPLDKIRVRFIGNIDNQTQSLVKRLKLEGNVELLGYLPHQQALSQLFAADLLLLIPSTGAGSELFVPAKLYEYLASGKYILCLADPGDSADLILKTHTGSIVTPTDTEKIIDQLVRLYQYWQNGHLSITPDQKLIQTFERRQLTGQLASIFNELIGNT